jgi:hypothetical protein
MYVKDYRLAKANNKELSFAYGQRLGRPKYAISKTSMPFAPQHLGRRSFGVRALREPIQGRRRKNTGRREGMTRRRPGGRPCPRVGIRCHPLRKDLHNRTCGFPQFRSPLSVERAGLRPAAYADLTRPSVHREAPMQTNLSIDAEAVAFLSRIVGGLGSTLGERRRSERRPFPSTQNVAPVDSDGIPPSTAFNPVQCHDISQTGVSFLWATKPNFKSVVIGLSDGAKTMHFMAGVRHFREGYFHRRRQFLVGCEFQCRVRYPRSPRRDFDTNVAAPAKATQ